MMSSSAKQKQKQQQHHHQHHRVSEKIVLLETFLFSYCMYILLLLLLLFLCCLFAWSFSHFFFYLLYFISLSQLIASLFFRSLSYYRAQEITEFKKNMLSCMCIHENESFLFFFLVLRLLLCLINIYENQKHFSNISFSLTMRFRIGRCCENRNSIHNIKIHTHMFVNIGRN